jgi:hypothetical protein
MEKRRSVVSFGAFLGECIIRHYGGGWVYHDGDWCIEFDDRTRAYPFTKVGKQMNNGLEDGIVSFFDMIAVFRRKTAPLPPPPARPWWKLGRG